MASAQGSGVIDGRRTDGRRTDGRVSVDTRTGSSARLQRRRAVSLLALTVVAPGTAQLAAGNRALGRFALRVLLGVLAFGALVGLLFLVSRSAALTVLSHRWTLAVLEWVLYGFAALWAVLLVDAWRLGRPQQASLRTRRWLALATVLALALPATLVYAGRSVGAVRDTVSAVFASGRALDAADGRYNILLLGGDSGANRVGTRPDSIQLASVDADTGRAVLFGFSRETEHIRFRSGSVMAGLMPDGWTCGDECLLNGLYTWAQDHADQFPEGTADPGVLATTEAVEALSGLDVQYHVLVDLKGFSGLIDAVGGLDITVQRRTPIGGGASKVSGYIEPGRQRLDGKRALWYARSRTGSTNYERMARQRCVVTALVKQLDPKTVVLNLADILGATEGVVRTDIPQQALPHLADLAVSTKQQQITSVNFVPPLIKPWDYDPEVVRSTVSEAIAASEAADDAPDSGADGTASTASAAPTPTAAPTTARPEASTPAVMERPGTDPDANTGDLAQVCAAS